MNFLIKLIILVAIAIILQFTAVFASKVGDKLNRERIEKLKEQNKRLIELNKQYVNDYISLYDNMRELKKENEELKKQLDKQRNVSYDIICNNIIRCEVPNRDEATPPLQKK